MGTERTATTPPAGFAKVTTGGNMSGACIKQEPSGTFLPRQYIPDGRVYQGFYAHGGAAFMSTEQEKLYLDYLWLDAQANPEKSLGDYLPDGMAKQLGMLHDALLPPFKPTNHGTPRAQPRPAAKTIALRFQNGRQQHYPRLILDEKFMDYLGEKALKAMDNSFVLCTDERLHATEGGAMSKKGAAAAKRAGGVGKPAVPPRAADSSDDEDSDAESGAGEGAAAGAEGGPKHKAKKRKKGAPPAPKGTLSLSHPTPPSPHSCAHFHY